MEINTIIAIIILLPFVLVFMHVFKISTDDFWTFLRRLIHDHLIVIILLFCLIALVSWAKLDTGKIAFNTKILEMMRESDGSTVDRMIEMASPVKQIVSAFVFIGNMLLTVIIAKISK